jgi:long-chain acyl-CoA synthetase
VVIEQHELEGPRPSGARRPAGRTLAWLAKQVELSFGDVDLSLPQYRVLALLNEGSAVASALAERLAVRPPSVTSVVDGLVARGLVDRVPRQDDRRRVTLRLTPAGVRVLAEADAAADARVAEIAGALGPEPAARLIEDLGRWHEAMVTRHRAATGRP